MSWDYGGTILGMTRISRFCAKIGEKMEQKISRKTENFSNLGVSGLTRSRLIIVPGFGAKKQAFRAKQIVPNLGVKFWHNRVKFLIKRHMSKNLVPNLKPSNSGFMEPNKTEFKTTNKSSISDSIPANSGNIGANTTIFDFEKPIRENSGVSEANTAKFTEKQVKLTAFLKPSNSGVIAANTAEFEKALICEGSSSQRLIRDYAECMSKK